MSKLNNFKYVGEYFLEGFTPQNSGERVLLIMQSVTQRTIILMKGTKSLSKVILEKNVTA